MIVKERFSFFLLIDVRSKKIRSTSTIEIYSIQSLFMGIMIDSGSFSCKLRFIQSLAGILYSLSDSYTFIFKSLFVV